MSLEAWAIDAYKSDAKIIRQTLGLLVNGAGGLAAAGALAVSAKGTPSMAVIVNGGTLTEGGAIIPGFTGATGPYAFLNTADLEVPIEAAGASNNRYDTVIARAYDTAVDSTGKSEPAIEVLRGKEEAGVTKGSRKGIATVPKNALVLAYIFVESKTSKILTEDIENVATNLALNTPVRQEAGAPISFLSWGYVSGAGTVEGGTGDFTVAKIGTGTFEVKWKTPKAAIYSVVATVAEGSTLQGAVVNGKPENKGFIVITLNHLNEFINSSFSFIALANS